MDRCAHIPRKRVARSLLVRLTCVLFIVSCTMVGCGAVSDINAVQQAEKSAVVKVHRPVALERGLDIQELKALVWNYDKAWVDYANKGDRKVFDYIEQESELYRQAQGYRGDGLWEDLNHVSVEAVSFAVDGKKAYIRVYEKILKRPYAGAETFESVEYDWVYEAKGAGDKWLLSRCDRRIDVGNRGITASSDGLAVNDGEYILGDWVYYTNPQDGDKLYRANRKDNRIEKLFDEAVEIVDAVSWRLYLKRKAGDGGIFYLLTYDLKLGQPELSSGGDGWNYFSDTYTFYKVRQDNSQFQRVATRSGGGKVMKIVEVKDGWIYAYILSEDGRYDFRIKTAGGPREFISLKRLD
ncbi:MAG: hypothetical protein P4N59_18315 [Negativicutes bacterium]|nr:hypothetical protein [Negativicutes bacterium]